ncbi:uncharacterized protein LOC141648845 [Silene latifolia]|uniref:uncharacterized protein LOC141648845 n=1 Tax=Silene latifolia TaxID=37657 RepID=UPI003D776A02
MSTLIDANPIGPKVDNLKEWVGRSKELLTDLQTRINKVRDPNMPIPIVNLNNLKNKKAKNTLQDERYKLNVTIPAPDFKKINAYLGCSHCGKRTDYAAGESFTCENCTKDGALSEPRITFNCVVSDGTDQLEITAFTADTTILFQMSASDIFHLQHSLIMRPRRKRIKELSGSTGPYTIRAKVIEKTNVHSEPDGQGLELQIITFQDEEGTKMRTFLHEHELEFFQGVIQDNLEYDISNAKLKLDVDATSENPDGQIYDIFFNIDTIVKPVSGEEAPKALNFVLIGSIPRKVALEDRYDVLGVVIYVDRSLPNQSANIERIPMLVK